MRMIIITKIVFFQFYGALGIGITNKKDKKTHKKAEKYVFLNFLTKRYSTLFEKKQFLVLVLKANFGSFVNFHDFVLKSINFQPINIDKCLVYNFKT